MNIEKLAKLKKEALSIKVNPKAIPANLKGKSRRDFIRKAFRKEVYTPKKYEGKMHFTEFEEKNINDKIKSVVRR